MDFSIGISKILDEKMDFFYRIIQNLNAPIDKLEQPSFFSKCLFFFWTLLIMPFIEQIITKELKIVVKKEKKHVMNNDLKKKKNKILSFWRSFTWLAKSPYMAC